MKKLTVTLALVLSLVLCVFAFASCDKSGKGGDATTATTAANATAAATTAGATTGGETEHVHTPAAEYTIDRQATCANAGSKSYHCTVCGDIIPETVVVIDPLPHTPEPEITVLQKATCSAKGLKAYLCLDCGEVIESTKEEIPIDEKAHAVEDWTVTEAVNMFHTTGSRNGECTICHQNIVEVITFQPTVKECTDATKGTYRSEQFSVIDVQNGGHFYPTDDNPGGNDLYIEFSILWNPTMLNLLDTADPYCASRLEAPEISNLTYWSGSNNPKGSWCPYAGGFEGAALTGGSPAGMMKDHGEYADYPNVGGSVAPADAENLDNGHEWGWHRIGLRVNHEVTNLSALLADDEPGKTAAKYKTTVTVYFDGVEIYSVYGDLSGSKAINRLFTVASNGDGTVTYTDIGDTVKAVPFAINSTEAKIGTTAYVVIADCNVTMGNDFAMKVEKVATPDAATLEVAEGVEISAPLYFKLAD